jgi:hypothetical protein
MLILRSPYAMVILEISEGILRLLTARIADDFSRNEHLLAPLTSERRLSLNVRLVQHFSEAE